MRFTATLTTADGTPVYDTRAYRTFIDALYGATFADHVDYASVTRVRVIDHSTGRSIFEGPRFSAEIIYPTVGCAAPVGAPDPGCAELLSSLIG